MDKVDIMKEIMLSDSQYRSLIKLLYLGTWMANSFRDDPVNEFHNVEQYFFSFAEEFKCGRFIEYDQDAREYVPTQEFDRIVEFYIDEYNDDNFWEELTYMMARRDLVSKVGEDKIGTMKENEIIKKEQPLIESYAKEFERNGLLNLYLNKPDKVKEGR